MVVHIYVYCLLPAPHTMMSIVLLKISEIKTAMLLDPTKMLFA